MLGAFTRSSSGQMNTKMKVKIIKKGISGQASVTASQMARSQRNAARDLASNVSGWVNDLQARKRTEAKIAFESLFKQIPSPSGS